MEKELHTFCHAPRVKELGQDDLCDGVTDRNGSKKSCILSAMFHISKSLVTMICAMGSETEVEVEKELNTFCHAPRVKELDHDDDLCDGVKEL